MNVVKPVIHYKSSNAAVLGKTVRHRRIERRPVISHEHASQLKCRRIYTAISSIPSHSGDY